MFQFSPGTDRVVDENEHGLPSTSLSRAHLSEALVRSSDHGATLDLTHKDLTDVGESGAEELAVIGREDLAQGESSVLRLALSFNRLTTLPMAFALLSHLRYLNLKNNCFSVFPDVLTVMPSLEILDISRNKLKTLPSQPGTLHNLRVLCLSRNDLTRLPPYFSQFRHLHILKVDHNPWEWPPKSVMSRPSGVNDSRTMKEWVRALQKWIEDDVARNGVNKDSDESFSSNHHPNGWRRASHNKFSHGVFPHARSFSADSDFSVYSSTSPNGVTTFSLSTSSLPERLTITRATSSSHKSTASPPHTSQSFLPSPTRSDISVGDEHIAISSESTQRKHARNVSLMVNSRSPRPLLSGKKSLPDLRTARLPFSAPKMPDLPDPGRPHLRGILMNKAFDESSLASPRITRQDTNPSDGQSQVRVLRPFAREPAHSSKFTDGSVPSMEIERNSYFRRFSTLPTSSICKTLPPSLLCLIDAARSILFAVCQVYQTLEHYTVFAIDDRLSSVLKKVLDPASADMMQLINALDRFDAMSRRALPSPAVCRSVVESCKDTVAVFGKAVGVLALQLKVLESQDDVRYLRHMVLVLYGATAEISHAWQAMLPHIDTVKPLLRERSRMHAKSYASIPSPDSVVSATARLPHDHQDPAQGVAFADELAPLPTRAAPTRGWSAAIGRLRTTRRNAGSFSSRDVEIGEKLPSYEEPPLPPSPHPPLPPPSIFGVLSGSAPETAVPRVGKRSLGLTSPSLGVQASLNVPHAGSVGSPLLPLGLATLSGAPWTRNGHSRHGSQASLTPSSSASSPSGHGGQTSGTLEILSNSKKLVDKEALDAMKVAVEAAPGVWEMMGDILGDVLEAQVDVKDILMRAKTVTDRLRENIHAVQDGDVAADRKMLRDDAHIFVKTVVQLSNIIKNYGAEHATYPVLRAKMVKLTNSTEEFVILLHVSSFSPSTPRTLTHGFGATAPTGGAMLSPVVSSVDEVRPAATRVSPLQTTQTTDTLVVKRKMVTSPARDIAIREAHAFNTTHYPRLGSGLPRKVVLNPDI